MLDKEFKAPFGNSRKGCSFDHKINHIIWPCSFLKWLFIHALVFSYGDQIRKISTFQNRRKNLFCILKTKKKWPSVVKGLSHAHNKDDVGMELHGIYDDVALEI